jgi:hypothetical protein
MSMGEHQQQIAAESGENAVKHDELYQAHQRIRQLEELNATLSTQVDRQAKVVDATVEWATWLRGSTVWTEPESVLEYVVRTYQREMAVLAKGKQHGTQSI